MRTNKLYLGLVKITILVCVKVHEDLLNVWISLFQLGQITLLLRAHGERRAGGGKNPAVLGLDMQVAPSF